MLTGELFPTFWKDRNVLIAGSGRSMTAKLSSETSVIIYKSIRRNSLKILGLETEDVCFVEKSVTVLADTTKRPRRSTDSFVSC